MRVSRVRPGVKFCACSQLLPPQKLCARTITDVFFLLQGDFDFGGYPVRLLVADLVSRMKHAVLLAWSTSDLMDTSCSNVSTRLYLVPIKHENDVFRTLCSKKAKKVVLLLVKPCKCAHVVIGNFLSYHRNQEKYSDFTWKITQVFYVCPALF